MLFLAQRMSPPSERHKNMKAAKSVKFLKVFKHCTLGKQSEVLMFRLYVLLYALVSEKPAELHFILY